MKRFLLSFTLLASLLPAETIDFSLLPGPTINGTADQQSAGDTRSPTTARISGWFSLTSIPTRSYPPLRTHCLTIRFSRRERRWPKHTIRA